MGESHVLTAVRRSIVKIGSDQDAHSSSIGEQRSKKKPGFTWEDRAFWEAWSGKKEVRSETPEVRLPTSHL
jgi:hypothetical protein